MDVVANDRKKLLISFNNILMDGNQFILIKFNSDNKIINLELNNDF